MLLLDIVIEVLRSIHAESTSGPPIGQEDQLCIDEPDQVVIDFPIQGPVGYDQSWDEFQMNFDSNLPVVSGDQKEKNGLDEVDEEARHQKGDKEK